MWLVTIAVLVLSVSHSLLGLISVCLGITSSIKADIWLAHSVSPIWSGGFIMCFAGFSIVSVVTALVSIQLLKLGLVNHTTDGQTFQKEHKDILILIALGDAGCECLVCLISTVASCRMYKAAKKVQKELQKRRQGTYHIQVLGSKDILIVTKRQANQSSDKKELVTGITSL